MLERRYRRTNNPPDRLAWVDALRDKHSKLGEKEKAYWLAKIAAASGSPSKLWRSLSSILHKDKKSSEEPVSCPHSADDLLHFFHDKVAAVRASTSCTNATDVLPPASSVMNELRTYTECEVRKIIMESPVKSCALDPIPTFMLRETIDVLLPFLAAMCNASLREGCLPVSQRHAIILPLLKKASLDPSEKKNYRPVSNLTFMSKVVERMVAQQLTDYLQLNSLLPELQSAYRRHHSTETALLCVVSDLLQAMDSGSVTLLGLLDLSAAFDTVDHTQLIRRLQTTFGVSGVPLAWVTSFLSERTQEVVFEGKRSVVGQLLSGVPQGSVLGPLLFLVYTAELFEIITRHGLKAHSYADDTQVYVSVPATDARDASCRFADCVADIDNWMNNNRLKLNTDKTQIIWVGSRQQLARLVDTGVTLRSATVSSSSTVVDLGVHLDDQLTMAAHVAHLSQVCYFQLRQLRSIRRFLSADATKTLVQALVTSRLDYGNSLLYKISEGLLAKVQRIQNAAARLVVVGVRRRDHIAPVLRQLHWLPIRQRVTFKIATLVYKCLHGLAPPYLARHCIPVATLEGRRSLRSAAGNKLFEPRTHTVRAGARPFAVCGPVVWNGLPPGLRADGHSLASFRRGLKTFLCEQL